MGEKLGKIEKPSTEDFKKGRKLFFIPLVSKSKDSPKEYKTKVKKYWLQVDKQLADLENKLGQVNKIFHEFVSSSGKEGAKKIEELDNGNYQIVKNIIGKGAHIVAVEDADILSEFLDWRVLLSLARNQRVFDILGHYYTDASKKRNEFIANCLKENLKHEEIGILFMRENHKIQFPKDIELFYISPPSLDEINRYLRDSLTRSAEKKESRTEKGSNNKE